MMPKIIYESFSDLHEKSVGDTIQIEYDTIKETRFYTTEPDLPVGKIEIVPERSWALIKFICRAFTYIEVEYFNKEGRKITRIHLRP